MAGLTVRIGDAQLYIRHRRLWSIEAAAVLPLITELRWIDAEPAAAAVMDAPMAAADSAAGSDAGSAARSLATDGALRIEVPEIQHSAALTLETVTTASRARSICSLVDLPPPRVQIALDAIVRPTPAHLRITLDGTLLDEGCLTLLPTWTWSVEPDHRTLVASYVLPEDDLVTRILRATAGDDADTHDSDEAGRRDPAGFLDRRRLELIYGWLAETCQVEFDAPRCDKDEWSAAAFQRIRSPQTMLDRKGRGGANCLDLTLLLAGCLERLGVSPLIVFTGTPEVAPEHAFLACWATPGRRFHPLLREDALRHALRADQLFVIESTGICRGDRRRGFSEAIEAAREHLASSEPLHAVDVVACRPPLGRIRPLSLRLEPVVQRAIRCADDLGGRRNARRREVIHLLYGLCATRGEFTSRLFTDAATEPQHVADLIKQHIPDEGHQGERRTTTNWEICLGAARARARSAGRMVVNEADLVWAVIQNPSRNLDKILTASGCDRETLTVLLRHSDDAEVSAASRSLLTFNLDGPDV